MHQAAQIRETLELNNELRWRLSQYLQEAPRAITREWMEEVNPGGDLSEEAAFTALLAALCGLDTGGSERDKRLADEYLRPGVRRLDPGVYAANPYYRDIRIPEERFGRWELRREHYAPFEGFVCGDLILGPGLREIPRIGFFSEAFSFPVVLEEGREWMAIKPNEIETMQPALDRVEGRVLALGLGLGYFAYMASLKAGVQSVTILERDPEAIRLFESRILPQFSHAEKIEICPGDAFAYLEKRMPQGPFDFAFVDLWHDASDGLEAYLRIKPLERLAPNTEFLYWIEDSLLSGLRWRVFQEADGHPGIRECLDWASLRKLAVTSQRVCHERGDRLTLSRRSRDNAPKLSGPCSRLPRPDKS